MAQQAPTPIVSDWSAKRAGAAITVTGKHDDGKDAKIPGVTAIEREAGRVIARHPTGDFFLA